MYLDLLNRYDEFGFFTKENFHVEIDSKENFDNNFNSNWYYYYAKNVYNKHMCHLSAASCKPLPTRKQKQ